jgi:exosome complex RNA-binding protein Csl4
MIDRHERLILGRDVEYHPGDGSAVMGRVMAVREEGIYVRVAGISILAQPEQLSWPAPRDNVVPLRGRG